VTLVSVQKVHGLDQLARLGDRFSVLDFGDELDEASGAFMDTGAILTCVDLVVTADTAIAQLAGALGADVWVALARPGDWRWLQNREDTPWYPSMKLFRQSQWGDWKDVFARIAAELTDRVANNVA
jgi:ADP-heptose:LPS heptosyltransferase